MESFNTYLKQFPNYTPEAFEVVRPHLSIKNVDAGDHFLQQGKVSRQIAFIESGLLRIYYLRDGKEVTNCFCKENSIITSYSSMITQQESELAIQTIEPSKLIILPYTSLQKLYEQHIFWQQVGRLASETEFIRSECHNRFLRDTTATERYQKVLEDEPDLLQRVPLTYLATYLQIAPETLSRIRKKIMGT